MSIAALGVKRSITPMPVGVGSSPCLGDAIPKPTYSLSLALVKEKVLFIKTIEDPHGDLAEHFLKLFGSD